MPPSVVQAIRFAGVDAARIDLYIDGDREQADYRGPFLFAWPAFTLPPGTHTLRAILIRTNGSSLRSAPVTVETTGAGPPEGTA